MILLLMWDGALKSRFRLFLLDLDTLLFLFIISLFVDESVTLFLFSSWMDLMGIE